MWSWDDSPGYTLPKWEETNAMFLSKKETKKPEENKGGSSVYYYRLYDTIILSDLKGI